MATSTSTSTIKQHNGGDEESQQTTPLLQRSSEAGDGSRTDDQNDHSLFRIQRAISEAFKSTADLANLLPTGTVLLFQLLSPVFTNTGQCFHVNQIMTATLIGVCGFLCFILSFSDSYKDANNKLRYGFATFKGLKFVDGSPAPELSAEDAKKYRIKLIDFVHGFVSVLIFAAVALLDKNVVSCFYPVPSESTKQVLKALPVGIGAFGSLLFCAFPTKRHGIGFPITTN